MSSSEVRWVLRLLYGWTAIAVILSLTTGLNAQQAVPSFEEIVKNLASVNASLDSFQVEQVIEARFLFFRFRFLSTVYAARPARYRVVVHNPPWLLRRFGNVFAQAGSPQDLLTYYAPRVVAWKEDAGRRFLYLDLEKQLPVVNPPGVEAFIDPERWLIEKMVLHYEWGDVITDYQYCLTSDFFLPTVINVRISNYPIEVRLTYQNYQLNVPIPDSVFANK